MSIESNSTPSFSEFDPTRIPYQEKVLDDLDSFDYKLGAHEILLSGSIGSSKSTLMAHAAIRHCLDYPRARVCLARRSMPDLKETILAAVLEQLEGDFEEDEDYWHNETKGKITFKNGSEIISRSWADKKYKRFRSLRLSMAVVEELTENDDKDKQAYDEMKMRVGRLPHVPQSVLISATNPDSPRHWAYNYFINTKSKTRHVYYSRTEDNPFLPTQYIEQLKRDLDPKQARRMIYGEWVEIDEDRIYYAYQSERNFKDESYTVNPFKPVTVCFDFNIGDGKPMSAAVYQYENDVFHIYNQAVVHGARTLDICEELANKGLFPLNTEVIIHGDATGKARSTRSIHSDYDLIEKFFSNLPGIRLKMEIARDNPPIRTRHNRVNAYCLNESGKVRLYVYKDAMTADEGLRLTSLKKGGDLIEDDSKAYQHITTAIGYGIVYDSNKISNNHLSAQRIR